MSAPDPTVLERAGFCVTEHTSTHWVLRRPGLHVDYFPTVGKFHTYGKTFVTTIEKFLGAVAAGRIRKPDKPPSRCNRCGASIYWVKSPRDKWMPVDPEGGAHMAHCRRVQ